MVGGYQLHKVVMLNLHSPTYIPVVSIKIPEFGVGYRTDHEQAVALAIDETLVCGFQAKCKVWYEIAPADEEATSGEIGGLCVSCSLLLPVSFSGLQQKVL